MRKRLRGLKGDLFGGLTAGVVALPLALAFGLASGAGPAAGLYGAIALGFFAALFGGTAVQVSGPTGPMTVIIAAAVSSFGGDFGSVLAIIFLAGLFQIALGIARVGIFVKFIPYPVISGFMTGIGIIIILLQLNPVLGLQSVSSPLQALVSLPAGLRTMQWQSILLGCITLVIVFKTPARVTRVFPSPLIALLAGSMLAFAVDLPVQTIGEIPRGLPRFSFPAFQLDRWNLIIVSAATLAILGTIDTLLTSMVADSLTKTRHNPVRELIGQGIGNIAASLVGGLAGAGATMRTVVNIKTGGTGRLSGIIHALFLLSVLLGLGPLASHIPLPVLAGILIKVGVDILDYRLLKKVRMIPRSDLYVMLIVLGTTVFLDLIMAVGIGVIASSLFLTYRMAKQSSSAIMGSLADPKNLAEQREVQDMTDFQVRVVNIQGPFFFGSTTQLLDNVDKILGTKVLIFNCLDVPFIDISAIFALEEMVDRLCSNGIATILVVRPEMEEKLVKLGVAAIVSEQVFGEQSEALAYAMGKMKGDSRCEKIEMPV